MSDIDKRSALKDMKITFDLMMNYTSDEDDWFKEPSSSRHNSKSDWYVSKDGKGKSGQKPPGSATFNRTVS